MGTGSIRSAEVFEQEVFDPGIGSIRSAGYGLWNAMCPKITYRLYHIMTKNVIICHLV